MGVTAVAKKLVARLPEPVREFIYRNFLSMQRHLPFMDETAYFANKDNELIRTTIAPLYTAPATPHAPRRIVFMCDEYCCTGGLCDRLRGMVSLYVLAQELGMDFKIYVDAPVRLEEYLQPNEYNWLLDEPIVRSVDALPYRVRTHNISTGRDALNEETMRTQHELLKRVITDNPDKREFHIYTNCYFGTDRFHDVFHKLFKPVARLQDKLDNLVPPALNYISVSCRFLNLFGDFKDDWNIGELSDAEKQEYIDDIKALVTRLYERHQDTVDKVFVASDSITLLDAVSQLPFVFVTPGAAHHTMYHVKDGDDNYDKEFIDFFLISRAEHVYLALKGKMYNSSYPFYASLVGNKPFTREYI